jgi:hypothetical protein
LKIELLPPLRNKNKNKHRMKLKIFTFISLCFLLFGLFPASFLGGVNVYAADPEVLYGYKIASCAKLQDGDCISTADPYGSGGGKVGTKCTIIKDTTAVCDSVTDNYSNYTRGYYIPSCEGKQTCEINGVTYSNFNNGLYSTKTTKTDAGTTIELKDDNAGLPGSKGDYKCNVTQNNDSDLSVGDCTKDGATVKNYNCVAYRNERNTATLNCSPNTITFKDGGIVTYWDNKIPGIGNDEIAFRLENGKTYKISRNDVLKACKNIYLDRCEWETANFQDFKEKLLAIGNLKNQSEQINQIVSTVGGAKTSPIDQFDPGKDCKQNPKYPDDKTKLICKGLEVTKKDNGDYEHIAPDGTVTTYNSDGKQKVEEVAAPKDNGPWDEIIGFFTAIVFMIFDVILILFIQTAKMFLTILGYAFIYVLMMNPASGSFLPVIGALWGIILGFANTVIFGSLVFLGACKLMDIKPFSDIEITQIIAKLVYYGLVLGFSFLGGVFLVNLGFGLAYLLIASRGANPADFLDTAKVLVGNIFEGGGIISAAGLTNKQWSWDYFNKSLGIQASMFGMRLLELVVLGVTIGAFVKALKNAIFQKIRIFFDLAMSAMTTALYFSPIDKLKETGNKLLYRLVVDAIFVPAYVAALIAATALAGQLGLAILEAREQIGQTATEGTKAGLGANSTNIFQSMEVLAESTSTAGEIASAFENLAAVAIVGLFSAGLLYFVAKYFDEKYSEDINTVMEMGKKGLSGLGSMGKWSSRFGIVGKVIARKTPWGQNLTKAVNNWADGKDLAGVNGKGNIGTRFLGLAGQGLGNVATGTHIKKMTAAGSAIKRTFQQGLENIDKSETEGFKAKSDLEYATLLSLIPGLGIIADHSGMPGTNPTTDKEEVKRMLRVGELADESNTAEKEAKDRIININPNITPKKAKAQQKTNVDKATEKGFRNEDGTVKRKVGESEETAIKRFIQDGGATADSMRDLLSVSLKNGDTDALNMMMYDEFTRKVIQQLYKEKKLDSQDKNKIEENYQGFMDEFTLKGILAENENNTKYTASPTNFVSKDFERIWKEVYGSNSKRMGELNSAQRYSTPIFRANAANWYAAYQGNEKSEKYKEATAGKSGTPPNLTYRQSYHIENNTHNDITTDPARPGPETPSSTSTVSLTLGGPSYDLTDLASIKEFIKTLENQHINGTDLITAGRLNPVINEVLNSVVDTTRFGSVTDPREKKELETRMQEAVLSMARTRKDQVKNTNAVKPEKFVVGKLSGLVVGGTVDPDTTRAYTLSTYKEGIKDLMKNHMALNNVPDSSLEEYSTEAINHIIKAIEDPTLAANLPTELADKYKITDTNFAELANTGFTLTRGTPLGDAMHSYTDSATKTLNKFVDSTNLNAQNNLDYEVRRIQDRISNAEKNATKVSGAEW